MHKLVRVGSPGASYSEFRGCGDGTPAPSLEGNYDDQIYQYTQELRLNGKQGMWDYVLGGF